MSTEISARTPQADPADTPSQLSPSLHKNPQDHQTISPMCLQKTKDHSMSVSVSLKMTPESCCYGGVLTGGLLKETEEEGFTFVTQNVTHNIR